MNDNAHIDIYFPAQNQQIKAKHLPKSRSFVDPRFLDEQKERLKSERAPVTQTQQVLQVM